jgi:hypothetical protein
MGVFLVIKKKNACNIKKSPPLNFYVSYCAAQQYNPVLGAFCWPYSEEIYEHFQARVSLHFPVSLHYIHILHYTIRILAVVSLLMFLS